MVFMACFMALIRTVLWFYLGRFYGLFKELFWVKIGYTIVAHDVLGHAIACSLSTIACSLGAIAWRPRYCMVRLQRFCSSQACYSVGFGAIAWAPAAHIKLQASNFVGPYLSRLNSDTHVLRLYKSSLSLESDHIPGNGILCSHLY